MQNEPTDKKIKVFMAMSGGVDSSVAAALLKQQGYDVTGVYMKNWSGDDYGIQSDCPWEEDMADVQKVCEKLEIPFRSFNFEKEYRAAVVEYFFAEYEKGRTPNPDVMCNKQIKFGLFLDKALQEGADMIATGHYARRREAIRQETEAQTKSKTELSYKPQATSLPGEASAKTGYQLLKGLDSNKDQSYFLYNLTQEQLSKTLFPIGDLPKPEVRKLAKEFGLHIADKPDSQGICFIGEINVLEFLKSRLPKKPGEIIDIDTKEKVGEHDGAYFFTRGQRKGLLIGGQEVPYFVVGTDTEKNEVYVGHGHDHPALMQKEARLENIHFISEPPTPNSKLSASVRYRHAPANGQLRMQNEGEVEEWSFAFDNAQWAITPGQSLVIYNGDVCLGGGVIRN